MENKFQFDDLTIQQMFGTDSAEDDDPERLRAYFFKNRAYQNIRQPLPLRILVGHKGIGKSALLRMSFLEDKEDDVLPLRLQPNDLVISSAIKQTFVEKIESYKHLISRRIYERSLDKLGIFDEEADKYKIQETAKSLIAAIYDKVVKISGGDAEAETKRLRERFVSNRIVRIYIDVVDRGWSASKEDINNISALINAARDLSNEDGSTIQVRIGLRSDAYFLYRTSDESTDKIEGNVIRLTWTRHDVLAVMALRVAHFFGKNVKESDFKHRHQREISRELDPVIEKNFSVGKGHWDGAPISVVLLSLNRNRPRDLIKLLTEAGKEAYRNDHSIITANDLEKVFANYSHGRITDLILEFKSELPDIEKLIYNMTPSSKQNRDRHKRWLYTTDELVLKIKNILQSHNFYFTNGSAVSAKSLAEFLYKIDFLIARSESDTGSPEWTHFDQNRMLQSQFVDFGYKWEVHPAYRWALQPKSVHEILDSIAREDEFGSR